MRLWNLTADIAELTLALPLCLHTDSRQQLGSPCPLQPTLQNIFSQKLFCELRFSETFMRL
jgi:hypothetical protein